MDDFIADDESIEYEQAQYQEPQKKQRKEKKHHHKHHGKLEDDDFDLIEENAGIKANRRKRLKHNN